MAARLSVGHVLPMPLAFHLPSPNVLAGVIVSLTFLALGFQGLRTGTALLKSYRFRRDTHYTRFWLVTTMWLGLGTLTLLLMLLTWIGEPRQP